MSRHRAASSGVTVALTYSKTRNTDKKPQVQQKHLQKPELNLNLTQELRRASQGNQMKPAPHQQHPKEETCVWAARKQHNMSLLILALLLSVSTFSARAEAKPLNQNQVKFRRLPPKEFSAALGSSITIECEAGASPPPSIHWLKNGKRILQNDFDDNQLEDGQQAQVDDVNRIALSTTRSRLFIDCADYIDEAVYTCVAENAFSRVSSHTKLNLIKPQPTNAGNGNDNELAFEDAALELAVTDGPTGSSGNKQQINAELGNGEKSLSAVSQCLSQRNSRTTGKQQ